MKITRYIISLALSLLPCLSGQVPGISRDLSGGRGDKVLRVALVGDPQVDNAGELYYARNSVLKELASRKDLDFAIFLGDIVNEAPELLPQMKESLDSLPFPYFSIPGNHDDPTVYRSVFGYRDTAFVSSGIRFILMDNSSGELTAEQKRTLRYQLGLPSGRTVLCTHIPLIQCQDSSFGIVEGYGDVLLVSAHLHRVFRETYKSGTEEVSVGATCGSWWRGPLENGIPYALMNCGAPRGYFVAEFGSNGDYSLSYKAVGRNEHEQASVSRISDSLYVNVWGGSSDGNVSVRLKTGVKTARLQCSRSLSVAPEVREVIRKNAEAGPQWRKEHRAEFIPLRKLPSRHLWSCPVPENSVYDKIVVRYRDKRMKFKEIL